MAETIHLNGTSLSLAHKGCMGFVKNTVPDVCKTPSPGGPIPIPYPVIVSFAKDLNKGTKTVKFDGGNSGAIKGSEYSRCIGDEPGTAGGIVSSTNMKEATWLLYSFDVKMEGKNACRLTDKMMMNHKNTVSLGGAIHNPVSGEAIITLDCKKEWNKCQQKQMCAKAKALDELAKERGGLQTRKPKDNKKLRKVGKVYQKRFRDNWNAKHPTGLFPTALEPCNLKEKFFDSCANKGDPKKSKMQADHVLELQFVGGNPAGPIRWLDSSVNQSSGSQIRALREKHGEMLVTGFETRNCKC